MTDYELVNKQTYLLAPLRRTTGRKDGNVSIFDSQNLLLSPLDNTIDAGRKSHCVRVEKTLKKGERSVDMVTPIYIYCIPRLTLVFGVDLMNAMGAKFQD